jgi:hypothetical protein
MDQRVQSGCRRVPPFRVRRASRQERRLRFPAACHRLAEEQGQGGGDHAARRAVPRQQGGRHPQEPGHPRPDQGHHRAAGQPVLRHRHPGLHRGDRQRKRPRADGHLHDRRQQGVHERRQQEPSAVPGHPQDRGRVQQADRVAALLADGAGPRDRRSVERIQSEHPAIHRQQRTGRPARLASPSARRHPQPRHQ